MHPIRVLGTLLLSLTSTAYATTAQLITSTNALTQQIDVIDTVVVALTAATPPTTAKPQQIPPSLQSLTAAIYDAITACTPTPPTSDPDTDVHVRDTYGLFTNSVEDLMADYLYQRDILVGVFELKASMYSQLTTFNKSYQAMSTFTTVVLDDAEDKLRMKYYIGNTTILINHAVAAFAP